MAFTFLTGFKLGTYFMIVTVIFLSCLYFTLPNVKNLLQTRPWLNSRFLDVALEPEIIPAYQTPESFSDLYVYRDFVKANLNIKDNESVTFSTQSTYELLHFFLETCDRWRGPMSVTIYAPGSDLQTSINAIVALRHCYGDKSKCIRDYISWHIIYPKNHGPPCLYNFNYADETCHNRPNFGISYRKKYGIIYPINIARNVAIQSSKTFYHLSVDNELFPSRDIIRKFLAMPNKQPKTAYVIATFELFPGYDIPRTRDELTKLIREGHAIFFRILQCQTCFLIPDKYDWIRLPSEPEKVFSVFSTADENWKYESWEPFYIADHNAPPYASSFSWDGTMDKYTQTIDMVRENYSFALLDQPFLCHSPGVRVMPYRLDKERAVHVQWNRKVYKEELKRIFSL